VSEFSNSETEAEEELGRRGGQKRRQHGQR